MAVYQVKLADQQVDKDGKSELKEVVLAKQQFISAEDLDRLMDLSNRPMPDNEDQAGDPSDEDVDDGQAEA